MLGEGLTYKPSYPRRGYEGYLPETSATTQETRAPKIPEYQHSTLNRNLWPYKRESTGLSYLLQLALSRHSFIKSKMLSMGFPKLLIKSYHTSENMRALSTDPSTVLIVTDWFTGLATGGWKLKLPSAQ